jgi:hypothetical protein
MLLKFRSEYLLFVAMGITGVQPVLAQLGSATISGSVSDSTGVQLPAPL